MKKKAPPSPPLHTIFHSALTTALVFVCMQVLAFTLYFNKTYVEALVRMLRVPVKTLAYRVAISDPDDYELQGQVRDVCGDQVDVTKMKAAAEAYLAAMPRTDEPAYPDTPTAVLLGFTFVALTGIWWLRSKTQPATAQAIFNGTVICAMFTIAEIVTWLVINTPKLQARLTASIQDGAKKVLTNYPEWCDIVAQLRMLQAKHEESGELAGWPSAYNDARRAEGVLVDMRRGLWTSAAAIVLGCMAGAYVIKTEEVKLTVNAFWKEVILTVGLVGVVQLSFLNYSTRYAYYGSQPENMADIATRAVCQPLGGPGQRPYTEMEPTVMQAVRATDEEIAHTSDLRNIATVYAGLWALLLLVRMRRSVMGTVVDVGKGATVAIAGWATEAYFYQFVVAQTVFVTWNIVESELLTAAAVTCPATVSPTPAPYSIGDLTPPDRWVQD